MASFESAIVPKWGASTICFRNVYVSRRSSDASNGDPSTKQVVKKKMATATPPAPIPFLSSSLSPDTYYAPPASDSDNYTMFDVNLDEVEVTLSFMRWLDGKGLVKDAKVKGVRGVVGESRVLWTHEVSANGRPTLGLGGHEQATVAGGFPASHADGRL